MPQVALAFLAHPDDAEILCAGTLIRLREAGYSIHIATATPGDCGTMDKTPWDIASIRTNEAKAAAAMMGATYHCIDERDVFVAYDKPTLRKVVDLFRRVVPSLVFTHAPADYMMDHDQVSMLARAASFAYGAPNVTSVPRNPASTIPHVYFCDPIEGIGHDGKLVTPTTVVDISAQMDLKTKMLSAHASQREWLRAHHGMDEYVDAMRRMSAMRGQAIGAKYAEAFTQYRPHAYPANDLLGELFGGR